ncbi:MAG: Uncharacterised protein [Cyanobium sp. ARS6]|nr:MAG: Uncharacterised protein [Cyanobium sp. ARS6]
MGDQLFNQSLAPQWIGLKIAGALKRGGQHLASQAATWVCAFVQLVELQIAGLLKLFQCQGVDKSLAEHPVEGPAQGHIPVATVFLGSLFQPQLLVQG